MTTATKTKIAWIHDGEPGVWSLGHFICPCGQRHDGIAYAESEPVACPCGRSIDSRGWITQEPPTPGTDTPDLDPDPPHVNGYEQRRAAKADRMRGYAASAHQASATAYDGAKKLAGLIPLGQPILVGHHSERHARRDAGKIAAGMDRAVAESARAETWDRRADAVEADTAISSWDPDARTKIEQRIADLEARQERMKAINATIRKAKPGTMDAALEAIGITEKERADLISAARFSRSQGYPAYALTNLGGNIRRLRERLTALARQVDVAPAGYIKAVPNKWPGTCEECGTAVEARAGFYASDADGNAGVQCAPCLYPTPA